MSVHAARWTLAIIGSVLANSVLVLLVLLAVTPQEEPDDNRSEARIRIESHRVDQQHAQAADARGDAAGEAEADGDSVSQASIPTSRSEPMPPSSVNLPATSGAVARTGPAETPREPLGATSAVTAPVVDTGAVGTHLRAGSVPESGVVPRSPDAIHAGQRPVPSVRQPGRELPTAKAPAVAGHAERVLGSPAIGSMMMVSAATPEPQEPAARPVEAVAPASPATQFVSSAFLDGTGVRPTPPRSASVSAIGPPRSERLAPSRPSGRAVASSRKGGQEVSPTPDRAARLAPATPPEGEISQSAPPEDLVLAMLAWTGGAEAQVDAASLSTIQSFMREGDSGDADDEVRDALSALLASVPCARLQTVFVPESGRLELHGHIPEEGLRDPVLTALRGQIGSAIPVADSMLILPRPQCGTLAAIAATALPQSSDQSTNPRIVGPDAYAKLYDFSEGERLVFELSGPDYPAHIYADYFDAEGTVIHLEPNELAPLRRLDVAEVVRIGADDGALELRVAPPFGQEIVVAMAASSQLYNGVRPIREPALPYLELLRERVEAARDRDPGFKGEWIYFFVRTHESG